MHHQHGRHWPEGRGRCDAGDHCLVWRFAGDTRPNRHSPAGLSRQFLAGPRGRHRRVSLRSVTLPRLREHFFLLLFVRNFAYWASARQELKDCWCKKKKILLVSNRSILHYTVNNLEQWPSRFKRQSEDVVGKGECCRPGLNENDGESAKPKPWL